MEPTHYSKLLDELLDRTASLGSASGAARSSQARLPTVRTAHAPRIAGACSLSVHAERNGAKARPDRKRAPFDRRAIPIVVCLGLCQLWGACWYRLKHRVATIIRQPRGGCGMLSRPKSHHALPILAQNKLMHSRAKLARRKAAKSLVNVRGKERLPVP